MGAGRKISPERWQAFFALHDSGISRYKSAAQVGIATTSVDNLFAHPYSSSGYEQYIEWIKSGGNKPKPYSRLSQNAKRAYGDFGYFRERYLGHVSRPWHVEAAEEVNKLLAAESKSFVVINVPPGSGKTTLWSMDIPLWLIVRNRMIRCLIGTGAESMGTDYCVRIRTALEQDLPVEASEHEKRMGLAKDAVSCLAHEFGRFKTENVGYWRSDKIHVAREGGAPAHQKEATVQSYGRRSGILGGRYDYNMWDDVVNDQNSRDADEQAKLIKWWRNTAERRIEPGGVILLMGQRLGPHDLYKHCIDVRDIAASYNGINTDETDLENAPRKYTHIVYKAHYDELCKGENPHAEWHHPDTAKPYPKGCLLDPQRLTQYDLLNIKADDPQTYATVFQQEDGDPEQALVQPLWINGGIDRNGVLYPGCWDNDRNIGTWPTNLAGHTYSVVTADPSPSNFWGVHWYAYQSDNQFQHLLDIVRRRMGAPDLLDYNLAQGTYTGLLEEWWQRSKDQGHPITHVIVESNAAQKFLLQYDHVKRWAMTRGVQLIAHQTNRNKSDPKYGVHALGPEYKFGRIRLPGHPATRMFAMPLYNEVTRYTNSTTLATTDQIMAHWFLVWNMNKIFGPRLAKPYTFADRPTWVKDRPRGLHVV